MKKWIGLLLAVMLLAGLAVSAGAETQGREMYVYTQNGKPLVVRSSLSTIDDNIIGSLAYGTKVFTYGSPAPGWTIIDYGDGSTHSYVMSRFLVYKGYECEFIIASREGVTDADIKLLVDFISDMDFVPAE